MDENRGGKRRNASLRALLPQGDELSASSQVVCSAAAQLSRSSIATGGIRNVLPLREKRRVVWINAGTLAAHERRPPVHDAGTVRGRVQRRERNVSELFQAFRY